MTRHLSLTALLAAFFFITGCGLFAGDSSEAYQKGLKLAKEGKTQKAYKYFLAATKKAPDSASYHWAAAQLAQNQNSAFIHTEMAWKSGMKNVAVLTTLLRLSTFTDNNQRITKMLSLFSELPDTVKTPNLKAELFSFLGASDSALNIYNGLYSAKPTPTLASKIGHELNVKGDIPGALRFLEKARKENLLDGSGYVLLASMRAYEYDYKGVEEIFKEARSRGLYTNEVALEEAAFLFVSNKQDASEKILQGYINANPDQPDQIINHRARVSLSFMYAARKERDKIKKMISAIPKESPFKAGEERFYKVLLDTQDMETTPLLQELDSIRILLPQNPNIQLYSARVLLKAGQPAKAAEFYKRLPGIYVRSPGILTEYAVALAGSGKENEALAALSVMHRKKSFTRGSLELFRDLTFRKNLVQKSEHAQQLLEKLYGNEARVRWNGAILALRSGKVDSAITLLTSLEKQFPEETRFRTTRISAMIVKGDYEKALELCHTGNLPREQVVPLETQILRKQGKDAEALQIIEKAVAEKPSPQLSLAYAEILMEMGKNEKAADVYGGLLNSRKEEKEQDAGTAAIYNNMAWAMLQTENPDKKITTEAIERAWKILPASPDILDTYAEALIRFGEYTKCITLLEESKVTHKEPKLMFQLGTAYEKKRDLNKAIRNYNTAIALIDSSSGKIDPYISKVEIQKNIDRLMEKGN